MPEYVSVVLCTYNDEKYIEKSIKSILNQTYQYFEFIIVDDGSIDNTNKIIKSFKDSRIVLIEKCNTGLIDSLNIGFSRTKYNWVARMDGDDIAMPDRIENQIKCISDDVAVIGTQCSIINENGENIGHTWFKKRNRNIIFFMKLGLPVLAHPTVLINKKMFNVVNGYDPKMFVAEDFDLWCKLSKVGKIVNIDKELLCLRKHSGNISLMKNDSQFINSKIALYKLKHGLVELSESDYIAIKKLVCSSFFYKISCLLDNKYNTKNPILRKMLRIYSLLNNILFYFFI